MKIPTNVMFVTSVLKTISTFLNILKIFIIIEKRYTDVIFLLGNCFDRKKQLQIYTNNFHKALKCNYCGILFTHAGHMKRHIKNVHEGCKDFKCESCGKSFAQADSLKGHIKTVHKGDKDFKCESYGKPIIQAKFSKRTQQNCS